MQHFAYDTETTGLLPYEGDDHIFAFALCDYQGNTEVPPLDRLQDYFDDTKKSKICHNLKFDLGMTLKAGILIPPETELHDTMIMSQLLRNLQASHALDDLAFELCRYPRDTDKLVAKYTRGGVTYDKVPKHVMEEYQKQDVERTMLLFRTFYSEITADSNLHNDYLNEIELIKTTVVMEQRGLLVDKEESEELIYWLEDELHGVYQDLFKTTGDRINLGSSQKLNELLYKKLKIEPIKKAKVGYSTDADVLMQLREKYEDSEHTKIIKVLDLLAKYRSYAGALPKVKNYLRFANKGGTIHPNIITNRARTGRESCTNPPLQGVSKNQKATNPYPVPLRKLFKARPGYVLFLPDYAGEEMRLIVCLAQDEEMTKVFGEGKNAHEEAAKLFYGKRFRSKAEDPLLYDAAKGAHFALPYGASSWKIAKVLGLTPHEGQLAFQRYEMRFPKIAALHKTMMDKAKKYGFIETFFGRKLQLPRDKVHAALNYAIQGTGAGILKRAQVRLHNLFQTKFNGEVSLLLPIHDELVIEYPRRQLSNLNNFMSTCTKLMTDFRSDNGLPLFEIPLEVEWKMTTTTWFKAEELCILK